MYVITVVLGSVHVYSVLSGQYMILLLVLDSVHVYSVYNQYICPLLLAFPVVVTCYYMCDSYWFVCIVYITTSGDCLRSFLDAFAYSYTCTCM